MGNICDIFSNREKEKQSHVIAAPGYLQEDINNIPKGIPVSQSQYPQVQYPHVQYPQSQVINYNPNQPVIIYTNHNPIADGFTTGLLGGIILSDLADDCY